MPVRSRSMKRVLAALYGLTLAIGAVSGVPRASATGTEDQARFLDRRPVADWDVTLPRGTVRQIDFETNQGTWMSVDISADGRWIVFDMLGHIYRMPASGGQAQSLTQDSGVALNYHPRFSPDGRRIAFVSDRAGQSSLWLMDADGSNATPVFTDPTTRILAPAWFPDGKAIVAVREFPTYSMHRRSQRIWKFPVDDPTEAPRELVGFASGFATLWPAVAPDGRSLYYMHTTFANRLHGDQDFQTIRRLDLATGRSTDVTPSKRLRRYHEGDRAELAPELSPDGRWLAYIRRLPGASFEYKNHTVRGRSALWLRDLVGGSDRILLDPVTFDMQNAHGMKNIRIVPGYAWAGDSRSLVIWRDGKIVRVTLDGATTEIPFSARVQRTLSEQARWRHGYDDTTLQAAAIRWPAVSKPNDLLIFEAVGEIWKRRRTSRGAAEVLVPWSAEAAFQMPAVSPDGRRIAFVSWNDHQLGAVYTCDVGACNSRRISTEPARYLYPAWHPDGESVYVVRSRGADAQRLASTTSPIDHDLVLLGAAGEKLIKAQVPPVPFGVGPGNRIFELSVLDQGSPQRELEYGLTIPPRQTVLSSFESGTSASSRQHLAFPAATLAALSPNGEQVLYREEGELYLARTQRQMAEYARGESSRWVGEESPLPLIKENPLHEVRKITDGGAHDGRWIDDDTFVYAAGGSVVIHDRRAAKSERIDVNATLPKYRPTRQQSIALTGARVITLRGEEVIERGDIVITGGRISCVGSCDVASANKVLSLQGRTVVPGFIDVHAHGLWGLPALPQQAYFNASYLAHGVTTTLDPAADDETVFPLAELIEAGRMVGPRMFSTGHHLQARSPQFGPSSRAEAVAHVKELRDWGARSVKVFLTPRRDQRQMYIDAARRFGMSATAEGSDMYFNVAAALDGTTGFEHPMQYLVLYKDAVEFFARAKVVYSPTITVESPSLWSQDFHQARSGVWSDRKLQRFVPYERLMMDINFAARPKSEYTFPFIAEGVAAIRRAGGFAAIGGHGELWGADSHWEMQSYAEAQTPHEVLAMASLGGARMIGLETQLGSIERGKLADLVILRANPLEDIRRARDIEYVMKGGVLYDGDSLDQRWPSEQPFGTPAWYREDVYRSDVYQAK